MDFQNLYGLKVDGIAGKETIEAINDALNGNKRRVKPSSSRGGSRNSSLGETIVSTAKKYIGTPYSYGSSSSSAFDCSGFTQYIYKQHSINIPRSSSEQATAGSEVSKENLQAGDLVIFSNTYKSGPSHAGIYVGKASIFIEEFRRHLPEIHQKLVSGFDAYLNSYSELPEVSLDYGIAEKSERMAVVPADFGWCDLGSWNALAELYQHDDSKNVCHGKDVIVLDSKNCVVKQAHKSVVLFGVDNLLVIETDDVILVSDRNKSQNVKAIVNALQEQQRHDLL